MLSINNYEFNLRLKKFGNVTEIKARDLVKDVSTEALGMLLNTSPVLTGRFRSTWDVAIGDPPILDLEVKPPTKDEKYPDKIQTFKKGKRKIDKYPKSGPFPIVALYDNLPYGPFLEDGGSRKAPYGVVKPTITALKISSALKKH